ncbi:MAG TPA: hypothetical protein VFH51_14160 [Myxococcota bacterium]|nr:hypothetical protein [Myxococcota bacterium]
MAGSPFGPEVPPDLMIPADDGMSTPPAGEMPVDTRRSGSDAALQALAALAMLAPMGRGAKGLAAALGITGGLTLASGVSEAAKKGQKPKTGAAAKKEEAAAPLAAEAQPPPTPAGDEVKDEYTEEMRLLQMQARQMGAQVERMGIQAGKGSHTLPSTQAELDKSRVELEKVTKRIGEITKARADRARGERQAEQDRITAAENERKANESAERTNNFRIGGGALGLTTGALMAYLASRKLKGAVGSFEKTAGDVAKLSGEKGNSIVAKGNVGPELHAGVNTAYRTGGAKEPLPPLGPIYGAETPAALRTAKDEFLAGTKVADEVSGLPGMRKSVPNSPFVAARAEKLSKGPSVAEKGLPIAFGGDALGAYGTSFLTDNPDRKTFLQDMSQGGTAALIAYGLARKGGGALARARPNELAQRAVDSAKERVTRDVASVNLKDLQHFSKHQGAVGLGGLPKPKGKFEPGDAKRMGELRDLRSVKGQARTDFVSNAHMDDRIVQAHAAAIGPDGRVDRQAFRQSLRQIFTATHDHKGEKLKMDDRMVAALMKAFGSR